MLNSSKPPTNRTNVATPRPPTPTTTTPHLTRRMMCPQTMLDEGFIIQSKLEYSEFQLVNNLRGQYIELHLKSADFVMSLNPAKSSRVHSVPFGFLHFLMHREHESLTDDEFFANTSIQLESLRMYYQAYFRSPMIRSTFQTPIRSHPPRFQRTPPLLQRVYNHVPRDREGLTPIPFSFQRALDDAMSSPLQYYGHTSPRTPMHPHSRIPQLTTPPRNQFTSNKRYRREMMPNIEFPKPLLPEPLYKRGNQCALFSRCTPFAGIIPNSLEALFNTTLEEGDQLPPTFDSAMDNFAVGK